MRDAWLRPDWPAPPGVGALATTRAGGVSSRPYASLNLGQHGGDDPAAVRENRERLAQALPAEPLWLKQVHGAAVAVHAGLTGAEPEADAAVAFGPGRVCAVLTADCLPVLFCDRSGSRVAAAHAGWRGLRAGVLEASVEALACAPSELIAWLGPAIGPRAYEVGEDVRSAFLADPERDFRPAFTASGDRWLLDLYAAARIALAARGVTQVFGGGRCTHAEAERFYSYRRDGRTGRQACLVWLR